MNPIRAMVRGNTTSRQYNSSVVEISANVLKALEQKARPLLRHLSLSSWRLRTISTFCAAFRNSLIGACFIGWKLGQRHHHTGRHTISSDGWVFHHVGTVSERTPLGSRVKEAATSPTLFGKAPIKNKKTVRPPLNDMKKCVRWSTITVYEFGVGLGGSSVPKHGGPSIGLARKPLCVWSTPLDELDDHEATTSSLNTVTKDTKHAKANKFKRAQRRRKVRWLKPLERVTMLTKAGCSEKRIFRMMMESSEIAMSRRLTLRVLDIYT
ncbi:hypothetical protein Plhal304r1_c064g0151251 [Plasmopara halstedii]